MTIHEVMLTLFNTGGAIWPGVQRIDTLGHFTVKIESLNFLTFPKYSQGPF